MDILYYIGGAVLLVIVVLILFLPKKKKPSIDISELTTLFRRDNVKEVRFERNKIAVLFNDITLFNPETLQQYGAKGISIVGDKIKFFVEGTDEYNEQVFNELKNYLERV